MVSSFFLDFIKELDKLSLKTIKTLSKERVFIRMASYHECNLANDTFVYDIFSFVDAFVFDNNADHHNT